MILRWFRRRRSEAPPRAVSAAAPRTVEPLPAVPRDERGLPDVRAVANHYGVPTELVDSLVASARPCFRLERGGEGSSRLGGAPDLPPGAAWPEYEGLPLTFFAQLRLDELPALDGQPALAGGMLQFFWDERYHEPTDVEGWCRVVHHTDASTPLEPRATPPGTRAEVEGWPRDGEYVEVPVRAVPWLSLDPALLEGIEDDSTFDAIAETLSVVNSGHRLLGYANPIQGPP